jgi:Glycosyl transferase 4-like domain
VVCYDFPGIGTAGVIRTYQFVKNLSSLGWQPIILTAQPCSGDQEDNIEYSDGRLDCPKMTVQAPRLLVPFETDHNGLLKSLYDGSKNGKGPLKPLSRFMAQLALPDGKIGWLPRAVRRALQVAREYPIKMCFSVSPRPTSHFVGRRVARHLRIPWVADFALPWSDAYWFSGRPRFIERIDQQLEGSVVRSAQHVTVAYADLARSMCARFGATWQQKISVIPTGFSDDLFARENVPTPAKFTVVYPGNHFCDEGRHGDCFLKAVDEWIGVNPRLKDKVEFLFIGKRDDELLRQRAAMAHPKVIRVEPFMSHRASVHTILSSHACVVNTVGNRIPDKVYECMRAGKWILALTDAGSDLENLLRRYSRGISIPAQDISAIRNALQKVWQGIDLKASGRIDADPAVETHSSKRSAKMLSCIFDGLLLSPRG